MPNHAPEQDAHAFSLRLKEAMADCGIETGHGAGAWLSRRFKTSTYSGNAWINGTHKPTAERAQEMARMFHVQFEWLYAGTGPKRLDLTIADAAGSYDVIDANSLTPKELEVLERYRAADESLRAIVDVTLQVHTRPRNRK